MRSCLRLFLPALLSVSPPVGAEEPAVAEAAPAHTVNAFDRVVGLGVYGTGWAGAYGAGGLGARVRLEPWRWLGVDLFAEAYLVTTPRGLRHDHPIGFNLYTPVSLGTVVRLRPLLGMCVVASFIEPEEPQGPRVDDVLVGAHAGAGFDVALSRWVSLFAEGKAVVWVGHDRSVHGWTGALANEVQPFVVGQAQLGLTVHLGPGR